MYRPIGATCWFVFAFVAIVWGGFGLIEQTLLNSAHFFSLPSGRILNDFAFFWGAAKLFWLGKVSLAFHPAQYNTWLATQVVPHSLERFGTWSYPPTTLVFLLPFGKLSLPHAVIAWDLFSCVFLAAVIVMLFRDFGLVPVILFSPAALYSFSYQQNGAITAALLIAGLWLIDRRPALAGVCIGLLAIKPQLAILLPFAVAAGGYRRAFASAALTAVGLVSLSILLFGLGSWQSYFDHTAPLMNAQLMHSYGISPQYAMPTAFVTLQGWGADRQIAGIAQAVSTLAAIGATISVWRMRYLDHKWRNCFTAIIILLATPFGYVYDMVPAMLAIALAARECDETPFLLELFALPALWLWPAISTLWDGYLHWHPIGCFLLFATAVCFWRRTRVSCVAFPPFHDGQREQEISALAASPRHYAFARH